MPIHKLTARFVETVTKEGMHSDGGNLFLQVRGKAKSWIFLYTSRQDKRKKSVGLGGAANVPLAMAREKAQECHRLLDNGEDPLEARRNDRLERDVKAGVAVTVNDILDKYFESNISWQALNYRKTAARFLDHIRSAIGKMPIKLVTTRVIADRVIGDWWVKKHPSAIQLQTHLHGAFKLAKVECGLASNPALWEDLVILLGKPRHKVKHRAALPYKDLPKFIADLRRYEDRSGRKTGHTAVAYALEFVVLTGARVDEVCRAQWKEIQGEVWTAPPAHLKTGPKHEKARRRPITKSMRDVLREMRSRFPSSTDDDLIFPSAYGGKINVSSLSRFVRDTMRWKQITVHGFRSTLNDWAKAKPYSRDWIKAQLDHMPEGKVDQAYTKDDLLDQRREMMEAYDADASRPEPHGRTVVPMLPRRGVRA
jgi:integrase